MSLNFLLLTRRLLLVVGLMTASTGAVLPIETLLLMSPRTLLRGRSCMQWFSSLMMMSVAARRSHRDNQQELWWVMLVECKVDVMSMLLLLQFFEDFAVCEVRD